MATSYPCMCYYQLRFELTFESRLDHAKMTADGEHGYGYIDEGFRWFIPWC